MADTKDLINLTVKELRAEAVKLGMPESDAEVFDTKKPLIATITTLQAQQVVGYVDTPSELKEDKDRYLTKVEKMRKFLEESPKTGFMIPLDIGEKPGIVAVKNVKGRKVTTHVAGAVESFSMNGLKLMYPKGVMIDDMPRPVAIHLSKCYNMTARAGEEKLIGRVDPKTGREVSEQL